MGLFSRWTVRKRDGKIPKGKDLEASAVATFLSEAGLPIKPLAAPQPLQELPVEEVTALAEKQANVTLPISGVHGEGLGVEDNCGKLLDGCGAGSEENVAVDGPFKGEALRGVYRYWQHGPGSAGQAASGGADVAESESGEEGDSEGEGAKSPVRAVHSPTTSTEGRLARTSSGLSGGAVQERDLVIETVDFAEALRHARKQATATSPLSRVQDWVAQVDPAGYASDDRGAGGEGPSSPPSWLGNELFAENGPVVLSRQVVAAPGPRVAGDPDAAYASSLVSKLDVHATTVQLASKGLKVVPVLSAFGSLRVLDLSRNSIARLQSGVLPRTLHWLDMSHNKLTGVEGLRELTRLRVLKLSSNRIVRIGHGLANCQSLRELYLGNNKISEVEGLHRLLKLQVLDLSQNKIASSKGLGQLAANHSSLQALDLVDNPLIAASSSDQMRRFIASLLSNLLYFNRQPIKASALPRDAAIERAALGSGHLSSRASKKGGRASSGGMHRVRSSSDSIHQGGASSHRSLGRSKSHSRLGSLGGKEASSAHHHHHHHHRRSHSRDGPGLPSPKEGGGHRHHHHSSHNGHSSLVPGLPRPPAKAAPLVTYPQEDMGEFEFKGLPSVRSDGALARVWPEGGVDGVPDSPMGGGQVAMQSEGEYWPTPPMSPHAMSAPEGMSDSPLEGPREFVQSEGEYWPTPPISPHTKSAPVSPHAA